ncbi:MAG: hypothetical protein QGH13_06680 [Candidatus Thalassarchaeaceae archaeon]|nr:hypothetical protein [Candidatus Thalassarchaeaceae archaeon]
MHGGTLRLLTLSLVAILSTSTLFSMTALDEDFSSDAPKQTSALLFGSTSGSNFIIDPGVGTNILVNITNQGSITDNANVSIISASGWNVVWARNAEPSIGDEIEIQPNELVWVQFRVDVPLVENGMPLAGSKHSISVKAISQIDGLESFWNFTIEVTEVAGISIDSYQETAKVEPGEKVLLPVTLRNTGNYLANLVIRVQPMLNSGLPVEGTIPDQSFVHDGWSVGTFDLYKIDNLPANESGVVQVEYAAPYSAASEIKVRITAYNANEPLTILSVNQSVIIERISDASIQFEDDEKCGIIHPPNNIQSGICHHNISLTNTGNYDDEIEIQILSNPVWSTVEIEENLVLLGKGETKNGIGISIGIINGTMAKNSGEVTVGAFISGDLISIGKHNISVDSFFDWTLVSTNVTVNDENLTCVLSFENTGNDDDGLMISLDMDVTSNFGLIPPPNAITDYSSENIRFFELRDIAPGQTISFSAYATTPRGLEMNGTAKMEVMVQSILEPSLNFSIAEDIEYLGENYRIEEESDDPNVFSELIDAGILFLSEWNGLILTIIVVGVGSILLNKALVKRQQDIERHRAKFISPPKETVEDWKKKFDENPQTNNLGIVSEKIDAEKFKENFKSKSSPSTNSPIQVDEELVDAATFILDHHSKEANLKDAASLANDLIESTGKPTLGEKLIPSKKTKKKKPVSSKDVVPTKSIGKSTQTEDSTDSDFDLDL